MSALPQHGYVDTAAVAEHLAVSRSWVRGHAAELGAVRLSDSKHGGLRFDAAKVRAALERRRITETVAPARRRPGRKPGGIVVPADVRDW